MNLDAAFETFLDESRTMLEDMERYLLELETDANDVEKLNALFRCVHTIKGAAGIFALDHVVEFTHTVEDVLDRLRAAAGKPMQGTVGLNAYHEAGSIVIEFSDDGRGLSRDKLLAKAIERGVIQSAEGLSEQDIFQLIFEPGFSTAELITNPSGRGVGMDVVRRGIEALRGAIELRSSLGLGTTVRIRLPLTLAIIDGFLMGVGEAIY